MVGLTPIPHWLEALLREKFFIPCLFHESEKKCEKNTFCLDCCTSLCTHCLPHHKNHHLLQIRRYVYQDVIRLSDAQKMIDCSFVQAYTTNSAKVVFINQRPLTRQFRGSGNICAACDRSLQEPYVFCCLSCKVRQIMNAKVGSGPTKRHLTLDSVFELPISLRTISSGSSSGGGSAGALNIAKSALACTATTDFTKKKRNPTSVSRAKCRPNCLLAAEFSDALNRRKGVPHRSPLF